MSKRCARCEKTVYPLEELKCLDKVGIQEALAGGVARLLREGHFSTFSPIFLPVSQAQDVSETA